MELGYYCDLVWNDFDGESDTRRHCSSCDQHVYNISNMTKAQAERVIEQHRDKGICVHFVQRDGRVVHKGDPLTQLRAQRKGARRLLALALIGQAGFLALADDPADAFFDPFAAAADALFLDQGEIEAKFEEANQSVVSGMVEF